MTLPEAEFFATKIGDEIAEAALPQQWRAANVCSGVNGLGIPCFTLRTHIRYTERMANVAESVERYDREAIFPASIGLTVRRMREKAPELLPYSQKGASKNSPQMVPKNLRHVLLGQAAHLPIDAADAAIALSGLVCTGVETSFRRVEGLRELSIKGAISNLSEMQNQTLGQVLDVLIASCASPDMRRGLKELFGSDWLLSICADPPFATISQAGFNTVLSEQVFSSVEKAVFGDYVVGESGYRTVNLPFKAILVAGELYQDSLSRGGESLSVRNTPN